MSCVFCKHSKVALSRGSYSVSDYDEAKMVIKNACIPSIWRNGKKIQTYRNVAKMLPWTHVSSLFQQLLTFCYICSPFLFKVSWPFVFCFQMIHIFKHMGLTICLIFLVLTFWAHGIFHFFELPMGWWDT